MMKRIGTIMCGATIWGLGGAVLTTPSRATAQPAPPEDAPSPAAQLADIHARLRALETERADTAASVAALKLRVAELEAQAAAATAGPPPATAAPADAPKPQLDLTLNGYAEFYYQWNLNDRASRLAGRDQAARNERRRVLQRELGAPVREPDLWARRVVLPFPCIKAIDVMLAATGLV